MTLGIRTKLMIPILAAFLLMAVVVGFLFVPEWKEREYLLIEKNQTALLNELASTLSTYLVNSDYAAVYEMVESRLDTNKDVWISLKVYDETGDLIYPLSTVVLDQVNDNNYVFSVVLNVDLNGYKVGELNALIYWKGLWAQRLDWIGDVMLALFSISALLLFASFLWQNILIRKPISKLNNAAAGLAKGSFDIELPTNKSHDEIGELTSSFEIMRTNLNRTQLELTNAVKLALAEQIRLSTIQDTLSSALIVVDSQGSITYLNPSAQNAFGYKDDEVIGHDVSILLPKSMRDHHIGFFNDYLSGKNKTDLSHRRELHAERKDGTVFPIDISIRAMAIDGKTFFNALITDISETREIQQQLIEAKEIAERASQAKSDFLARMSHEIRTPMNGILGMANILSASALNEVQQEQVQVITSSGDALMLIINDILDLAKIESKQMLLESLAFNLHALVKGVLDLYQVQAQKKNVQLGMRNCHENVWLKGDPLRIRQILQNLVNNALKFTEQGSVVVYVEAKEVADSCIDLLLSVRDSGCGIETDVLEALFEPFKQADSSTTRTSGGTGLGLAICKSLAELMGGEMYIESEVGVGSTFSFNVCLPIADEEDRKMEDIASDELKCTPTFVAKVLVVDDVPVNLLVIKTMLENMGIEIVTVENGAQAINHWQDESFDMILMDCEMPEMDGYTASQEIRHLEVPGNRIPIIALTANAYEGNRQKCLSAGMDDFLTKPVDTSQLVDALNRWLR